QGSDSVAIATDLVELLDEMRTSGVAPVLSAYGISSLLHHGLVKLPHTEYEDVYLLAMGDVADISADNGRVRIEWSVAYPWINSQSAEDREPSTRMLLDLTVAATERKLIAAGNSGFLMLSSGKDSTAIALALAEGGFRDVAAVTFSQGDDDPEAPIAARTCARLGLKHRVVKLPSDPAVVADTLIAFYESTPRPGVDLSQIPYVLAAAMIDYRTGAVFDGGGNDSYMALLPGRRDVIKQRFRLRGRGPIRLASRLTRVDSPVNYLARSRAMVVLSGRTLRLHESREIYPEAVDTGVEWRTESARTNSLDLIDLYGAVKERHGDPAGSMLKQRLAAQSVGMTAALPFCDHGIADYYFNLPEQYRFDRKSLVNKKLLRSLLLEFLDYDADAIGKQYFMFDGAAFVVNHMDFVRSEIDACTLWDKAGLTLVHDWLDGIGSRPLLHHSILTIFMISGWHNHSRFLSR
ncbi:MAG: asparagine synthase-related protein, partial [Actinomycetota bacterium]|nr:asparagine synthase-related protein [Actinomycetota bacterium]